MYFYSIKQIVVFFLSKFNLKSDSGIFMNNQLSILMIFWNWNKMKDTSIAISWSLLFWDYIFTLCYIFNWNLLCLFLQLHQLTTAKLRRTMATNKFTGSDRNHVHREIRQILRARKHLASDGFPRRNTISSLWRKWLCYRKFHLANNLADCFKTALNHCTGNQ